MEKASPGLQRAKYKLLAGAPPHEKSEWVQGGGQTGRRQTRAQTGQEEEGGDRGCSKPGPAAEGGPGVFAPNLPAPA